MKPDFRGTKPGVIVRLLSPLGSYPEETFLQPDTAMVVSPGLCFIVNRIVEEDGFSEIDYLNPFEIPLLASMLLCVEKNEDRITPYPTHQSIHLSLPTAMALEKDVAEEAGRWLISIMKSKKFGSAWPTDLLHRPPALNGVLSYHFITSSDRLSAWQSVLSFMRGAHPVYLRGVACLVKANMALQHPEFFESALLSLWIALDAAHSIVLDRLRQAGNNNPSSKDAASYVYEAYGIEGIWEKFFEEDYENRIRFCHPDNRFGAEARPCGLADNLHELNGNLIDLYYFFATGIPRDNQS